MLQWCPFPAAQRAASGAGHAGQPADKYLFHVNRSEKELAPYGFELVYSRKWQASGRVLRSMANLRCGPREVGTTHKLDSKGTCTQ
eukprot:scaffold98355_cov78-Phaeocystis_antarctica.AAC.1